MTNKSTKTVMLFGTFDYLHAGHENLFKQARELGDEIVTIIARDETVKKIKGESPDHSEKERLKNLKATQWSETVVLGSKKDKSKVIKEFRPDIIALGYDQFAFTYRLEKLLMDLKFNTKVERLRPYRPDMYKSSIIKYNRDNEKRTFNITPVGQEL